jgi:hypothetical protein
MLAEELSGASGHARILAAVGRGRSKYSEIASDAGQRVEQPLETLIRAGFLGKALPVGAPKGARPLYEIPDPYLRFWFSCLYATRNEIESGQARAVLRRTRPVWQRHLGGVFEDLARAHARRLSERGVLPDDLLIGRWWATSGMPCEVDVLGLTGTKVALLGEARLQDKPLDVPELARLMAKADKLPKLAENPKYALWSRSGVTRAVKRQGALGFKLSEMLKE